jgi:hypothetical protein
MSADFAAFNFLFREQIVSGDRWFSCPSFAWIYLFELNVNDIGELKQRIFATVLICSLDSSLAVSSTAPSQCRKSMGRRIGHRLAVIGLDRESEFGVENDHRRLSSNLLGHCRSCFDHERFRFAQIHHSSSQHLTAAHRCK